MCVNPMTDPNPDVIKLLADRDCFSSKRRAVAAAPSSTDTDSLLRSVHVLPIF